MKELLGTPAFVTGAVSGIGLGIATALILASRKVTLVEARETALATPGTGDHPAGTSADQIGARAPTQ